MGSKKAPTKKNNPSTKPLVPVAHQGEHLKRLRAMLALEIAQIVEDLDCRRELLLDWWSKHRDRTPFLETLFTRWKSLGFIELAAIETEQLVVLHAFYHEVEEFRMYFAYTQDMPVALSEEYDQRLFYLNELSTQAIACLGGVPPRPMVEFPEDREG